MIEFFSDDEVIGTVAVRGTTLLSDITTLDVAESWLREGNSPRAFEAAYANWSNGYVSSRKVPNVAVVIDDLSKVTLSVQANSITLKANEDKYDSGGMIALIPSDADLNRLTLDGEEPRDDLHLTLWYLGDDKLTTTQRENVLRAVTQATEGWNQIEGNAFGVALWNPNAEKPAWVLNVGDASDENSDDGSSNLADIRLDVGRAVASVFDIPQQHTPWQPHICIAYSSDELGDELRTRLGPVTFDKVRVAYGRDVFDVPLG